MNESEDPIVGISLCGAHACPATPSDNAAFVNIGRRAFISQSALLAAAAALAACGASSDTTAPAIPTTGTTGTSGTGSGGSSSGTAANVITIANYPTLASVNGVAMVAIGSVQLAVVRTGASTFVALSRVCPHQGGIVNQSGNGFVCPVHGAEFSLTGTWIGGQRTSSLHAYTTAYDATAGTLTIT